MPTIPSPSRDDVTAARMQVQSLLALRITAAQDWCCDQLYTTRRVWQQWESGCRDMHPAFWELFQRKLAETKAQRSTEKS